MPIRQYRYKQRYRMPYSFRVVLLTMWQRQKVSLLLSVKLVQRSASEKKNEPYFLMAAR